MVRPNLLHGLIGNQMSGRPQAASSWYANSGCQTSLGVLLDPNEIAAFVVEAALKPQRQRAFHAVS
jgi:hypothetical protein